MTKLADAVTDYLSYLQHEKGSAPTTRKCYGNRLNAFLRWMAANGYPDANVQDYTINACRRYLYHLGKNGNRPRTVRGCFDSLRGFGTFLVNSGALKENPAAAVKTPKLDAAKRLLVTDADVAALFEAAERQRTLRQVALSRAVLSILCYTALRRAEVCNLLVSDVDLIDQSVLVRSGKGGKSRKVFINRSGVDALREWLAVREKDSKHLFLFSIDRNRRMAHVGIAHLVDTLAATAGMRGNEAVKPHSLRHWALTNLLRNGANLKDVQTFAGHGDLQTTARYLHSSEEQLRSIAELTGLRTPTPAALPADMAKGWKPGCELNKPGKMEAPDNQQRRRVSMRLSR